ncbi:hypothetical protein [Shinella sp. G-2]
MIYDKYNELQQLYLDFLHAMDAAPKGFPKKFDFGAPPTAS